MTNSIDLGPKDEKILISVLENLNNLVFGRFSKINEDIDATGASEILVDIAESVNKLVHDLKEFNAFSYELANGRLYAEAPPRYNYLASNIKSLHSQILHLTWQAKRVQEGDYSQSVDFMGEFSEAFNGMIKALDERTRRIEMEMEANRKAREELARSQQMLKMVLENINDIIIVISENDILFASDMAKNELKIVDDESEDPLFLTIMHYTVKSDEIANYDYFDNSRGRWFQIRSIPISWLDIKTAYLYVVSDITERKKNEEELTEMANTDELTGVGSRRRGLKYLNECLMDKTTRPICLCYIDVDGLKTVNDTFGHNEGDRYIRAISTAILDSTRKDDNVSRIGGDEFMVVFVNKSKNHANIVLKRINERLKELEKVFDGQYPLSFSYGIEEIVGYEDLSPEQYIILADKKMYENKRKKRQER
ncbi:MAG: diguanylate cyclase [Syntrophomonadaceae bacterium]|jgi:diguanylate cyclase (GGDEF)-like protein|nr:diguanylate cyclase [Syntrophomonadaceae bacterium]